MGAAAKAKTNISAITSRTALPLAAYVACWKNRVSQLAWNTLLCFGEIAAQHARPLFAKPIRLAGPEHVGAGCITMCFTCVTVTHSTTNHYKAGAALVLCADYAHQTQAVLGLAFAL